MKSYDELLKENELLKREVKALDEEGVMKCELNEKLSKALDKACEELASLSHELNMRKASPYAYDCDYTKEEEWREWCMKDE